MSFLCGGSLALPPSLPHCVHPLGFYEMSSQPSFLGLYVVDLGFQDQRWGEHNLLLLQPPTFLGALGQAGSQAALLAPEIPVLLCLLVLLSLGLWAVCFLSLPHLPPTCWPKGRSVLASFETGSDFIFENSHLEKAGSDPIWKKPRALGNFPIKRNPGRRFAPVVCLSVLVH